jgi:hypothetical protein
MQTFLFDVSEKLVIARVMNVTGDVICSTCQTSNGFSSADLRSIIVMVVLTSIVLLLCYVGVLWYAIRTRFIPDKPSNVIVDSVVNKNEAFDDGEEEYEPPVKPIDNITTI